MSADSPSSNPWLRASELLYPTVDEQYDWLKKARPEQLPPPGDWWVHLLMQGRGAGKALGLNTPIPTPTGWTRMGALQTGDQVLAEDGQPCTVTFVTEEMHERKCYRLAYSDGTKIIADAEHQWTVLDAKRANRTRTVTTYVLLAEGLRTLDEQPNWTIPLAWSQKISHVSIVSIEPVVSEPVKCIQVDSPNHLYLAGEGMIPTHNTRTGAETVKGWAGYQRLPNLESRPGCRIAVVSPTAADARDVCMEGDSGLLSVLPSEVIKNWNRSMGELTLKNGTKIKTYSAEEPERLRGPQFHFGWCDEIGAWTKQQETWDQLMFGLRLGKKPKVIATTTPRPTKLIRELVVREGVHVTRGSTFDNAANLAPTALAELKQKYENTRLGRQELYAELLLDTPGALWTLDLIDRNRVRGVPDMVRVAVAVDPSGGEGEGHDEQGIIVVGKGTDGEGYCLDDRSCSLSPDGWARRTVQAYLDYAADVIIVEKNFGGDMAMNTVKTAARDMGVKVNIGYVSATRGKQLRAEPVAALFEQNKFHCFGLFEELEQQLTSWTPSSGKSPDRIDALVMGATELLLEKDRPKMRFYS